MSKDFVREAAGYRLQLPLALPYRWRGGLIEHFDAVLVVVRTDDGRTGSGEGTPVLGYSFESMEDVWAYTVRTLKTLVGRAPCEVLHETRRDVAQHPFACAALRGALEDVTVKSEPRPSNVDIPLVGTVRPSDQRSEVDAARDLVRDGYSVLKVKIGNDVETDLARIGGLQRVDGARLRLDANQGYSRSDAAHFLSRLDPEGIELVEQPLVLDDWAGQAELHARTDIPLMLDESIWTDDDIRRAADVADVVKLKVMKSGGADVALHQSRLAQESGLSVVIGNGVATEIDAIAEARVYLEAGLHLAAEFNGFAKQVEGITLPPLVISRGRLTADALAKEHLINNAVVERHCVDRVTSS